MTDDETLSIMEQFENMGFVQPIEILNHTGMSATDQAKFVQLSVTELCPRLVRSSEIERRLRKEADERRTQFKPPHRGDVAVEIPQIPNLKAECENFLYEAKNYLRATKAGESALGNGI
jgi:hypothetical protein